VRRIARFESFSKQNAMRVGKMTCLSLWEREGGREGRVREETARTDRPSLSEEMDREVAQADQETRRGP
jgi:hypothetical protein